MKPIIQVRGLSKQYRIGVKRARYGSLRESLVNAAKAPLRALKAGSKDEASTIWALKDVSFDVMPGEVVGVIGRNGAGKSTLLKVLTRITEPTKGEVDLYGRVASLLEVGTGFHPELTGRENIYLNGAILGMHKAEIDRKFDEIVAFAEVEKFLDTPVKHFSSGMYVRLAFAVAAHLEPEILLVDEVLAVGDARFQERCISKMEEVGRGGRTVLFVSHNMASILRLTQTSLLLSEGEILASGPSSTVTQRYLGSEHLCPAARQWDDPGRMPGDRVARLAGVRIRDGEGVTVDSVKVSEEVYIEVEYICLVPDSRVTVTIHLYNEEGVCLFSSNDWNNRGWWNIPRKTGRVRAACQIPSHFLAEGRFFVLVALGSYNPNVSHCLERNVVSFQVIDDRSGGGVRGCYGGEWPGVLRPMLEWTVACDEDRGKQDADYPML
jgi:lipopolysaccharide transport system ATP-binding protein